MKYAAFISHAGEERKLAVKIVRILESFGLKCWISRRDIAAGDVYGKDIINALENSHICILILSRLSNSRPGVHNEIERAFSKRIPIICLRVEDVQPSKELEYFVSSVQWVDAWGNQFNQGMEYLKSAMAKHMPENYQFDAERKVDHEFQETLSEIFLLKCRKGVTATFKPLATYLSDQKKVRVTPGSVKISGRGPRLKFYSVVIPPPESVGSIVLGRSPGDPRGQISHAEITRKHAVVKWLNRELCICDNESLNGTYVNGERLTGDDSIALRDGDRVQLGPVRMRVKFL